MIKDAKDHKFETVLIHKFNRFYRDQYKSMFYKKMLKDYRVKVISISEELGSESIQGFMMERIIETLDQVSSMQTAWETMKGMKENAESRVIKMVELYLTGIKEFRYQLI
jgi:site-specific DNA recombinase